MSKKGLNIYKRKDGRWEGRIRLTYNGTINYKSIYGHTYRQVREKLLTEKDKYLNALTVEKEKINYPADQLLMDWLDDMKVSVKESTFVNYKFYVEKYILPCWKDLDINLIDDPFISVFLAKKAANGKRGGKPLSESTMKTLYYIIQAVFKYAFQKNMIRPFNISKLSIHTNTTTPKVIHHGEQRILEAYILKNPSVKNLGILLSLYTGVRIGELCALKWENINLSEGFINIKSTLQRIQNTDANASEKTKIIITEPKSQSSHRTIPLAGWLTDILQKNCGNNSDEQFFLTDSRQHFYEPRSYSVYFCSVLKRCGIRKINFHACRHTFASRCIENGVDPKTVSVLLGHTTVTMTLNKYVHSNLELQRRAVDKLSSGQ